MIYQVITGCKTCPFAKKTVHPLYGFATGPDCTLGGFNVNASYYEAFFVGGWLLNPGCKVYTNVPRYLNVDIPSAPIDNRCPLKQEVCLVKLADEVL